MSIILEESEVTLLEITKTHPKYPLFVFEPISVAQLRENVRLLPHSMANTLAYKLLLPEQARESFKRLAEEYSARFIAQLYDPDLTTDV